MGFGAIMILAGACSNRVDEKAIAPASIDMIEAASEGDVAKLVRDAQLQASRERRKLLVYVSAEWCEPCKRFQAAAASGALDAEFANLRLLKFDFDRDEERLAAAGYASQLIPLWVLPEPSGRASEWSVAGSIKGSGAVAEIRPRLRELAAKASP